jgi:tetratricopeptide (TPR) repeat protein
MPTLLHLTITDYLDATRWRWVLKDHRDCFLADHNVHLDPTTREYRGFRDLSKFLDYHKPIHPPEQQLEELGAWIGEKVFGGLREKLWENRALPASAVRVLVPPVAKDLLSRPFELARFADGMSFRQAGVRFVYGLEGTAVGATAKEPVEKALRILTAFSLPVRANPLNLRRERFGLQKLVRELNQTQNLAVELRVLQYGATRQTLKEALQEAEGWDIIQLSGHGQKGELLLENNSGGSDAIDADDLGGLLDLTRSRLKLLILDACYSGVGSQADAREQVGLDRLATRQEGAAGETLAEAAETELPSLSESLSERLDCAVLAMRYPVGDAFATELMLALYGKLLAKRQPLPGALHLALEDALASDIPRPPLSPITPILVGARAADLRLAPPPRQTEGFALPRTGLSIGFPPEPERFVGRLQPMLRASQALAPGSAKRGVLFHGMPGAGKTACALELAYRHEHRRFQGHVWHRAPEAGTDISNALFNLMQDIQSQLGAPDLGLTTALDQPDRFRQITLPRLGALLKERSLLLVLDNLETLLTDSDRWRDPLWVDVVGALLAHDGPSRVVLTSRRVPADLENHAKVQVEAIHALSFAESILLARELPNLRTLFDDEEGRRLLQRTLWVAQGHPKLLELADGLAADRPALAARVAAAADDLKDRLDVLDAFFAVGGTREGESRQEDADFLRALQGWTVGVAGTLTPTARLLFTFLCCMEPADRRQYVLVATWKNFLTRLGEGHAVAATALAEPDQGRSAALAALEASGLVGVERPTIDSEPTTSLKALLESRVHEWRECNPAALQELMDQFRARETTYNIHSSVAETARISVEPDLLGTVESELGEYYIKGFNYGLIKEMEGGGHFVVASARRAAPYLLRQERWREASALLERMLQRDGSPASLAFAVPLLRRIVVATVGTENGLENTGILARALGDAGSINEAERLLRGVITESTESGNYQLASGAAGSLLTILQRSGRLEEALTVSDQAAGYAQKAGFGPWTQLGNEASRLQLLAARGYNEKVLNAVKALLPKMDALPMEDQTEEAVSPWNVRETLLDAGRNAAMNTQRWSLALAFNAEIAKVLRARGSNALEKACTRLNDAGALLQLRRYDDARKALMSCRAVFESKRYVIGLGGVYFALADLENRVGDPNSAIRFAKIALGYAYQVGQPDLCAKSHYNLADYLEEHGADRSTVMDHRLAAAVIWLQTGDGQLGSGLSKLTNSDLPIEPPTFLEVAQRVESIAGVQFRQLIATLPRFASDGEAALADIWQRVARAKPDRDKRTTLVLSRLEPVMKDIAAAVSEHGRRANLETELAELEKSGWRLAEAAHRIWAGERDAEALIGGLDRKSAQLVLRVLEILNQLQ